MKSFRIPSFASALMAVLMFALTPQLQAADKIGVLLLHGKSPGSAQDPNLSSIHSRLQREGMLVQLPDMPWSRNRYIDGNWDTAMNEIAANVKALREKGATKIVIAGHSLGVPAGMSYAARNGDVQALVLLAPGHIPKGYHRFPTLSAVRDCINDARAMVAAGKGDEKSRFCDINQGLAQVVVMTAKDYLSYFDPESDAEMSVTAPRIPAHVPSLVVIGNRDPLFKHARAYFADKLTPNPKNQYLEISADHLSTAYEANDQIVEWIRKAVAE